MVSVNGSQILFKGSLKNIIELEVLQFERCVYTGQYGIYLV